MNKIAIIYWSGSGNTEAMANAIKTGVDGAGVPCDLYFVSDFDVASINDYDGLILGCPATDLPFKEFIISSKTG